MPGPYDSAAAAFRSSEMSNRQKYADPVTFYGQTATSVNPTGQEQIYSSRPRQGAVYQVDSEQEDDMKMRMDMADTLNARSAQAAGAGNGQQIWNMQVTDDMVEYAKNQRRAKELAQKHAIVATMFDSRKPGNYEYINQIAPEFHQGAESKIAEDAEFAVRNHLVSYTGIRTPEDLNFVIQRNAGKFKGPILAIQRNPAEWYRPGPFSGWNFNMRAKEGEYKQHILSGDPYWGEKYGGANSTLNVPGSYQANKAADVFSANYDVPYNLDRMATNRAAQDASYSSSNITGRA